MAESSHFGGTPGTPVPAVDPEDLKAIWRLHREITNQRPGQSVGIDRDVIVERCKRSSDVHAVAYRTSMLQLLQHVSPNLLAPWTKETELDDVVFRVAADIPMDWIGAEQHKGLPFDVEGLLRRLRGEVT
jgi:hypothetical protein